jgi:hypothetical protein
MPGGYSIGRLFREARRALSEQFSVSVVRCETPHHSRWWLVRGLVRAMAPLLPPLPQEKPVTRSDSPYRGQ